MKLTVSGAFKVVANIEQAARSGLLHRRRESPTDKSGEIAQRETIVVFQRIA